ARRSTIGWGVSAAVIGGMPPALSVRMSRTAEKRRNTGTPSWDVRYRHHMIADRVANMPAQKDEERLRTLSPQLWTTVGVLSWACQCHNKASFVYQCWRLCRQH